MSTQRSKLGPQWGRDWPEDHSQLGAESALGPRSESQSLAPPGLFVLEHTQAKPGQVSHFQKDTTVGLGEAETQVLGVNPGLPPVTNSSFL